MICAISWRVMFRFGSKRPSPVPETMPSDAAQATLGAYHCPTETSENVLPG